MAEGCTEIADSAGQEPVDFCLWSTWWWLCISYVMLNVWHQLFPYELTMSNAELGLTSQPENTDGLWENRKINDYTSNPTPSPGKNCCNIALWVLLQWLAMYRDASYRVMKLKCKRWSSVTHLTAEIFQVPGFKNKYFKGKKLQTKNSRA